MLFNSTLFLLFFAIGMVVYFAIPHRSRWVLPLTASYIFYISPKPAYVVLFILLTLISYDADLQMGKTGFHPMEMSICIH
jgi:hypothetical protein